MYLNNMNSGGIPARIHPEFQEFRLDSWNSGWIPAEFQKFRVDCGGIPGFQPESVEE